MSFSKNNILGNNTSNQAVKTSEKSALSQNSLRGPDGKFISKKSINNSVISEPKPTEIESVEPEKKIDTDETPRKVLIATFYGIEIRKFYIRNSWYFSIEDILPLAQYGDPHKSLEDLKNKEDSKKVLSQFIKEARDSAGNTVECVDFEGFMALLPFLRGEDHIFPGPFPDWLKETSQLPF